VTRQAEAGALLGVNHLSRKAAGVGAASAALGPAPPLPRAREGHSLSNVDSRCQPPGMKREATDIAASSCMVGRTCEGTVALSDRAARSGARRATFGSIGAHANRNRYHSGEKGARRRSRGGRRALNATVPRTVMYGRSGITRAEREMIGCRCLGNQRLPLLTRSPCGRSGSRHAKPGVGPSPQK
jgi:hypothetical protein